MATLFEILQSQAQRPTLKRCSKCNGEYFLFHPPLECTQSEEYKEDKEKKKKDKHPNRDKNNKRGS